MVFRYDAKEAFLVVDECEEMRGAVDRKKDVHEDSIRAQMHDIRALVDLGSPSQRMIYVFCYDTLFF